MNRLGFVSLIIIVVVFFGAFAFIASKIQVDGYSSITASSNATSLLTALWTGTVNAIGSGIHTLIFGP